MAEADGGAFSSGERVHPTTKTANTTASFQQASRFMEASIRRLPILTTGPAEVWQAAALPGASYGMPSGASTSERSPGSTGAASMGWMRAALTWVFRRCGSAMTRLRSARPRMRWRSVR